jgi:azurin
MQIRIKSQNTLVYINLNHTGTESNKKIVSNLVLTFVPFEKFGSNLQYVGKNLFPEPQENDAA